MSDVAQHTPTPWHTHGKYVHAKYGADGKGQHHAVACAIETSPSFGNVGTAVGNARLLKRAVNSHDELLAVVENVVAYLRFQQHVPFTRDDLLAEAQAAVANVRT